MAQKAPVKKTYTSHRGRPIDIDGLRQRNELTPAVGNARVNARGDKLGPGGKIIQSRESMLQEYYNKQGNTPDEVAVSQDKKPVQVETKNVQEEVTDESNWVEDEDGNFVQKKSTRSRTKS